MPIMTTSPYGGVGSGRPQQSPWQSSSSASTNNATKEAPAKIKVCVLGAADAGKTSLLRRYCYKTFQSTRIPTVGSDFYTCKVGVPLFSDNDQKQGGERTTSADKTGENAEQPAAADHDSNVYETQTQQTPNPNNQSVVLHMWDTPGRERQPRAADDYTVGQDHIDAIVQAFVGRVDGVILVYDMTSSTSFTQLRLWHAHWMKTLAEYQQKQQKALEQQHVDEERDAPGSSHNSDRSLTPGDHSPSHHYRHSNRRSSHHPTQQIPILIVGNKRDQALANQQKQQQKQLQQIALVRQQQQQLQQNLEARKRQQLLLQQQKRTPRWHHHHRRPDGQQKQHQLTANGNTLNDQQNQPIPAVPQRDVMGLLGHFKGKDFRYEYRVDHHVMSSINNNNGSHYSLHNPSPRNSNSHLQAIPNAAPNTSSNSPRHPQYIAGRKRHQQRSDPAIISTYSSTAAGTWTQDGSYLDSLLISEDGSNPDRDMVVLWCMRNGLTHMEISAMEENGGVDEAVECMLKQVIKARGDFVRQKQELEKPIPQEDKEQSTATSNASGVRRNQALDLQLRFGPKDETCCFGWLPTPPCWSSSTKQNAWT